MVQMRPNFTFMNNKLKRKRETEHSNVSSEDEEEAGPSTAQQVTVKFKQSENERWKKATVNSYKTLQRKSQEEAWVPCKWHTEDSATSEVIIVSEFLNIKFYSCYFYTGSKVKAIQ